MNKPKLPALGFVQSETRMGIYLATAVVFASLLPMGAVYWLISANAEDTLTREMAGNLEEKSILIANSIDRHYRQRRVDITNISQADVLESDDSKAITQYIAEISGGNPHLEDIEVSTLEGVIISHSSNPLEVGIPLTVHYPFIGDVLRQVARGRQDDVYFSEITQLDESGNYGVILTTPITDDTNTQVIKILTIETNLDAIRAILPELGQGRPHVAHHVHVLDNRGRVIVSTDPTIAPMQRLPDLAAEPALLAKITQQGGKGAFTYRNHADEAVVAGYADLGEFGLNRSMDWSVLAIAPYEQLALPVQLLNNRILAVVLVMGMLVFIGMVLLNGKVFNLIWQHANFDLVTGLPNRRLFMDRLKQQAKVSQRSGRSFALLYIDLDRFKEVNDTLGHDFGDSLLIEAGKRIASTIRGLDSAARIGGDEFAVIITEIGSPRDLDRIAENIIQALNRPFNLHDNNLYLSASLGITLFPDDCDRVDALLKNADQAMYESKRLGRNRFSFFTRSMQESAMRRMTIANDFHQALDDDQFELFYQPIIDVKTGLVAKAEALIRWQHPERGLISPGEFIPIAEDTYFINELGDWIFDTATRQLSQWKKAHAPDLALSINVSPVQFKSRMLLHDWLVQLHRHGLSGGNIIIEITEGLLVEDDPKISNQLLNFRDSGIQVALDDFGTGYSSLSYLNKFDIDYLKIDKAFVDHIATDNNNRALCQAIISMAHTLGLEVVAEGIETREQLDILSALDLDFAQGYLFHKPLPVNEFETLLTKRQPA